MEPEKLEEAFRKVIAGDRIFRTAFVQEDDGIFARIRGEVPFSLPVLQGNSLEEVMEQIRRPFCLGEAPLLRAGLWQNGEEGWFLLIDVHHIIADGMSTPILAKRLSRYYEGGVQEYEELGYQDYAYALSNRNKTDWETDRRYWKEHLSPLPEPLLLPTDKPRPKNFDFQGKNYTHRISAEITRECTRWSRENGISPYMLFLGAYGILLSSVSGKREIMIGTPAAGRNHRELQEICGPFINTMPLRLAVDKETEPLRYLQDVRQEVTGMLEHPDCSLEEMISMLGLPRSFSDNPLYQAAFSMRPFETGKLELAGIPMEYVPFLREQPKQSCLLSWCWRKKSSGFSLNTLHPYLRRIPSGFMAGVWRASSGRWWTGERKQSVSCRLWMYPIGWSCLKSRTTVLCLI